MAKENLTSADNAPEPSQPRRWSREWFMKTRQGRAAMTAGAVTLAAVTLLTVAGREQAPDKELQGGVALSAEQAGNVRKANDFLIGGLETMQGSVQAGNYQATTGEAFRVVLDPHEGGTTVTAAMNNDYKIPTGSGDLNPMNLKVTYELDGEQPADAYAALIEIDEQNLLPEHLEMSMKGQGSVGMSYDPALGGGVNAAGSTSWSDNHGPEQVAYDATMAMQAAADHVQALASNAGVGG